MSGPISVEPRSGGPGISTPRASRPASNLESGRRLQSAGGAELEHQRSERVRPLPGKRWTSTRRSCMGRWPFPTTITVSSSATSAASPPSMRRVKDRRRVRTCEDRAERLSPGDGMHAAAHRDHRTRVSAHPRLWVAPRETSSGCRSPASSAPLRGLERDLVAATVSTCAHDEAGMRHPPFVGVEVRVDEPLRRLGRRGDRRLLVGLDRRGWAAWPAIAPRGADRARRIAIRSRRYPVRVRIWPRVPPRAISGNEGGVGE